MSNVKKKNELRGVAGILESFWPLFSTYFCCVSHNFDMIHIHIYVGVFEVSEQYIVIRIKFVIRFNTLTLRLFSGRVLQRTGIKATWVNGKTVFCALGEH